MRLILLYFMIIINDVKCNTYIHQSRILHRNDILKLSNVAHYKTNSTSLTSVLLFDIAREQIIVGARDLILRLSLRSLRVKEQASWITPANITAECEMKGQSELACHNYVKVLHTDGERLFACGTNGFSPLCSWRMLESVSEVLELMSGVAKCSHNPADNMTSLLTSDGNYYSGTPINFASSESAIYRSYIGETTSKERVTLSTSQHDQIQLNEPQFVGSFDDDHFVYFVFREESVEHLNSGKVIYSRLARVCKSDNGESPNMNPSSWSTYLKTRLICSNPGEYAFYYDNVQSIYYDGVTRLLFGVFTTPSNGVPGSAICVYNMTDVGEVFNSGFLVFREQVGSWFEVEPTSETLSHFNCDPSTSGVSLIKYRQYKITYRPLGPISKRPIYKQNMVRLKNIAADVIGENFTHFVLYTVADGTDLMKISVPEGFQESCVIEVWRIGAGDIEELFYLKETDSIFVSSPAELLRIPVRLCSRYQTKDSCSSIADPYCSWDNKRDKCMTTTRLVHNKCYDSNKPIDGGWSSWSEWSPCVQDSGDSVLLNSRDSQDTCECRSRTCDNPKPANGGRNCEGVSVGVRRCVVHGGWTEWSQWSPCTATCNMATKIRRRACVSPRPANGGRVCVGPETQDMFCNNLPPCPEINTSEDISEWSAPVPKKSRRAQKKVAWTPWLVVTDDTSNATFIEKRFKFTCELKNSDKIKLSESVAETRPSNGVVPKIKCPKQICDREVTLEVWSEWSPCKESEKTDYGVSYRTRGDVIEKQACLQETGAWGAWDNWSDCTADNIQVRRRTCEDVYCVGAAVQSKPCFADGPIHSLTLQSNLIQTSSISYILPTSLLVALLLGAVIGAVYYKYRKSRSNVRVPTSPHYITTANTYVTIPLKEPQRRAKRQPSFSGISTGTNTLVLQKSNNLNSNNLSSTTPKLYPKSIVKDMQLNGTLKYNNQLRNNIDADDDNFY